MLSNPVCIVLPRVRSLSHREQILTIFASLQPNRSRSISVIFAEDLTATSSVIASLPFASTCFHPNTAHADPTGVGHG